MGIVTCAPWTEAELESLARETGIKLEGKGRIAHVARLIASDVVGKSTEAADPILNEWARVLHSHVDCDEPVSGVQRGEGEQRA